MSAQTEDTTADWRRAWIAKRTGQIIACWIIGGTLLVLAGGLLALAANAGGLVLAVAMAVAGQALLMVAVVATGVRLGIDGAVRSR